MKIIVFDTETTGLPKKRRGLIEDDKNWPHMIQLAWLVVEGRKISKHASYIIKLGGNQKIPEASTKIHKITNEDMDLYGVDIKGVLEDFMSDLNNSTLLVAHNLKFDYTIIKVELFRNKMFKEMEQLKEPKGYCTMLKAYDKYKLRSPRTGKIVRKYPKLSELYKLLFADKLNNDILHDALIDSLVCLRCFYRMRFNIDIKNDDFIWRAFMSRT